MDTNRKRQWIPTGKRMIRLHSLFWKLFIAFFLTMQVWLFGGSLYFKSLENPSAIVKVKAYTILHESEIWSERGLQSTLKNMKDWNIKNKDVQLSLLDKNGNLLHGAAPTAGGSRKSITLDGNAYIISTNMPAEKDPSDHPPIEIPIITAAIISLFVSWILAWYLSSPLQHLRNASKAVAHGKFSTRVSPSLGKRRDEIVDLAHDFDRMAAQLQSLMKNRQRLFHDISHELRSPLTRMQAAIGLLRQNPSRANDMIERVERESVRINTLVEEVLSLARLESGLPIAYEEIDVSALLSVIVEDARLEAEHTERILHYTGCSPFIRMVNSEILCRAFDNVIRNALHYTPSKRSIFITAINEEKTMTIHVDDEGPGVNGGEYNTIFEAFQRSENSATKAPGFGLGLSISRQAVDLHNGSINAEHSPYGGLRITIKIPRTNEA